MTKPLVLRIITRLAGGGPPMHVTLLNRDLPQQGIESMLVFGDCAATEKNMDYLLAAGDRTERIPELGPHPHPLADFVALWRLWRLMRIHRPAIVHTHTAKAGLLGRLAALFAGVPCIVHTYHGHVLEGYFNPFFNRILQFAERSLGRISHALCTVSAQQAEELSCQFAVASSEKFHIVPLGIDLNPLIALPSPDFSTPRLTLTWLGRFVPIKNLPLLMRIAIQAESNQLPVDFVIAGEGAEREFVEEQIRTKGLNHVRLLPWQDRIEAVLSQSHLLILTSHREGTPLALIQGMAAGRPFVSTPAGGTVDLCLNAKQDEQGITWGENAVLVPPQEDQFLAALQVLLMDRQLLGAMSAASRSFALAHFSGERLVNDLANLYRHLLAAGQAELEPTEEVRR